MVATAEETAQTYARAIVTDCEYLAGAQTNHDAAVHLRVIRQRAESALAEIEGPEHPQASVDLSDDELSVENVDCAFGHPEPDPPIVIGPGGDFKQYVWPAKGLPEWLNDRFVAGLLTSAIAAMAFFAGVLI